MRIFHLPDLGEGLAEAEIREWYVKEGDTVKVDQPLVSMETAKAVVDVPSPHEGKITKLNGKNGDIIKTHAPLVEYEGEPSTKDKGTVVGTLEESDTLLDEGDVRVGALQQATNPPIKAMPAVRALAKQLNVDLMTIKPSGPQGQIIAEDVKKASGQEKSIQIRGQVEALHGVRRTMAMVMTHSHREIVPVTLMDDADISNFAENADVTVSVLKAIIAAAQATPALNAWYEGKTMERCLHKEVHVGLAMDTKEGLFVPVIKQADQKNEQDLRAIIDTFKKTVNDRTISSSDLQGATITLSNFGMFAGRYANPIIISPQVAILGCGRIREEARAYQGKIEIRRVMPLSLTFDHRAVTGGEASRFLGAIIKFLEEK
jgi:2-oxoisovalerate dehydrogenase E2 component (dihydrolipoyl transacylase)